MAKCKFKVGDKIKPTKDNDYCITGQDMELGVVTYVGKCGMLPIDSDIKVKVLKHKIKKIKGIETPVNSRFFEKVGNETIVIYSDGNKVTALDKSTGKKAFARCNPADEFDFRTGAKLAFSRLMGEPEEKPQDKPKVVKCDRYEVGDKVLVRDWDDMEREFGVSLLGGIKSKCAFTSIMREYCNRTLTIGRITDEGNYCMLEDRYFFYFSSDTIAGKVVEEFKPYLKGGNTNYGTIGEETPFKDAIGRPLRIGDTVEIYDSDNELLGKDVVVNVKGSGAFVMGLKSEDFTDKNGSTLGFKIILKRKYEDIADGETVGVIKYIKSQK